MISIATTDYSKLKREYLRGNISYRELAKKYDVPFGTLRKVAAKEQWTQLRTQARTKADTKIIDAISDKEVKKALDIIDVADRLLEKILEVAESVHDTQSIKQLTSAVKDIKDIKGIKSEADRIEQMARIAKLQKEAMEEDNSNTEIKVTFGTEGERSKWAE